MIPPSLESAFAKIVRAAPVDYMGCVDPDEHGDSVFVDSGWVTLNAAEYRALKAWEAGLRG